jgi:hypothetical protein
METVWCSFGATKGQLGASLTCHGSTAWDVASGTISTSPASGVSCSSLAAGGTVTPAQYISTVSIQKQPLTQKNSIVSEQNCRQLSFKPRQFCLDTIRLFVSEAGIVL